MMWGTVPKIEEVYMDKAYQRLSAEPFNELIPFLSDSKNFLGWVRRVTKRLESEWGGAPTLNWHSTRDRRNAEESEAV